jgi:hypothetical protein
MKRIWVIQFGVRPPAQRTFWLGESIEFGELSIKFVKFAFIRVIRFEIIREIRSHLRYSSNVSIKKASLSAGLLIFFRNPVQEELIIFRTLSP